MARKSRTALWVAAAVAAWYLYEQNQKTKAAAALVATAAIPPPIQVPGSGIATPIQVASGIISGA